MILWNWPGKNFQDLLLIWILYVKNLELIIVDIEANQNGQLGSLLRQNLLRDPDYYILKYTGRPMTCTEVYVSLKKILEKTAEKIQVLTYGA